MKDLKTKESRINEKSSNKALIYSLRKSTFISFKESIEAVLVTSTFAGVFFLGAVIAQLLSVIKFAIKSYSEYYNWLFDWHVSKNS